MKYYKPLNETDENAPYVNGDIATGTPGSLPDARGFESSQREIVNTIIEAGKTPDADDNTQLKQAIAILSHNEADKIVRYQSLYQRLNKVENGVIKVADEKIINFFNLSAASSLSIDMSNVTKNQSGDVITFELYIKETTPSVLTWFKNQDGTDIFWAAEENPDIAEAKLYVFTFRSFDTGATWHGSLDTFFSLDAANSIQSVLANMTAEV